MEAETVAASTSEAIPTGSGFNDDLQMTDNDQLPPKESEVLRSSGEGAEAGDDSMTGFQMQNPLPTWQPPSEGSSDGPVPGEQYIPLVELMQLPPKPAPRIPPPPVKPRKPTKGRKGKGCYHQLAENLAVELQAINEKLVNGKLEMPQVKELGDVKGLPGLEEDSYVFVSQQGNS